jgi:hypothetical protein
MKFKNLFKRWSYSHFVRPLEDIKILQAKVLIEQNHNKRKLKNIHEAEFKVFSQFGDDGIIQYILDRLNIRFPNDKFIEFGVGDYTESNTRFLLINNNWSGLIMDSSEENIDYIKNDEIYWKYDLLALCKFVEPRNINNILSTSSFTKDIGLMHIDLDGNDYWVWKSIEVCKPIVVIVEYNSVFGLENAIVIPYKRGFVRGEAHYSNLYWGASIKALYQLAKEKGYSFVGTNSAGNNAYFVRNDYTKSLHVITCKEGYVVSRYRESRDEKGNLDYLSGDKRLALVRNLLVVNMETGKTLKIKELNQNERQ